MPIIVNVPGGKFDSAGRGVAAAQGYRANEQQMRQRDEAFEFEKATTLRKIQFAEEQQDFEREQLAQQQESEAAVLMGKAIGGGAQIGNPGAYQALLAQTSPRFKAQMLETFGRAEIERVKRAEIDDIMGELPLTPETEAAVHEGRLTDPAAIQRAMATERGKIARTADQEESRLGARESWAKIQAEPGFVMPDETMDADAHGSVMEILAELYDGAATKPGIDYRALTHELDILTNPNKLKAARAALQRAVGGVDIRGNPKMLGQALDSENFRSQVEGDVQGHKPDSAPSRKSMLEGKGAKPAAGGAKAETPQSGAQVPAAGQPKSVAEIDASAVAGGKVDEKRDALIRTAMANLKLTKTPAKGTPGRVKLAAEIKRLEDAQKATPDEEAAYEMQKYGRQRGGM